MKLYRACPNCKTLAGSGKWRCRNCGKPLIPVRSRSVQRDFMLGMVAGVAVCLIPIPPIFLILGCVLSVGLGIWQNQSYPAFGSGMIAAPLFAWALFFGGISVFGRFFIPH